MRILLLGGAVLIAFGLAAMPQPVSGQAGAVVVIDYRGTIDPVAGRFLERALGAAAADGAELVVIRLDTPGGLLESTRSIVGAILASPVPVAVYVAPAGARAASAGTFVTAAAGIAAMAPGTNIGAAAVVGPGGEDLPETLGHKAQQDAAAFMRSIAERRGRPVAPLEAAVLEAAAYSAEQALDAGVIDLIATDVPDLLSQLDGRAVPAAAAEGSVVVHTAGASIRSLGPNFIERALGFLSNPNVAFLLFSLGGLALVVELWTPGTLGPGIVGVILLLLAFAGLGNLPFSWAGVALLVLAIALFAVEAYVPGFGVFGIAGIVALVLGGVFLVGFFGPPDLPGPGIRVSPRLLIGIGVAGLVAVGLIARSVRKSLRMPRYVSPVAAAALVEQTARVTVALDPEGEVSVAGETWRARLTEGGRVEAGRDVVVRRVRGLVLEVAPPDGDRAA